MVGVHGWGVGDVCRRGAYMVGGGGVCMMGGVHGGGGHAWQGGAWWGHVWQGGVHGRGACVAGGGGMRATADTTGYGQ